MKTKLDILKWLMPLAGLLTSACGYDHVIGQDEYVEEPIPYVELRIAMPAGTAAASRANPMGGEEGDGRERGMLNEDKIHDVNVFFYIEQDGKGMDSPDDTKIINHFFYNIDRPGDPANSKLWTGVDLDLGKDLDKDFYYPHFEKNYLILRFQIADKNMEAAKDGINFVTIANAGPMQEQNFPDLGSLRDYDLSSDGSNNWNDSYDKYSMDASKMDYFLMSTAYNDNYEYGGLKTGSNKIEQDGTVYYGTSTLQRMYARLDLWYNETENAIEEGVDIDRKVKELKYPVIYAAGNMVYITNVLPVNVMQKPSYIFKKVTNFVGGWALWTKSGLETYDTFSWGGKENPSDGPYSGTSYNDLPLNYVMEPHTLEKTSDGNGGDLTGWYGSTAARTVKESIASADNGKLSAYYHGTPNSGSDYDANCNHISVISYANENTHPTDCFHSNYLTGMAFRAVYVPAKIIKDYTPASGDVAEVLTEMTEDERKSFVIDDAYIFRYSSTTLELDENKALYFSDHSAMVAYKNSHSDENAIVTTFKAGRDQQENKLGCVCYYNLWLRHYNDENGDPQANYPMEYATVRNNIYRVKVSFTGPGDPTPTMREPDTMQARIYVRKWNFRNEDTFYFE